MSKAKKQTSTAHDIVILTIITVISGLLLGLVNNVTEEPIRQQEAKTKAAAMQTVFADADSFSDDMEFDADKMAKALEDAGVSSTTVNTINAALDADGNTIGYVLDVSNSEGYGGEVELMAGITTGDSMVLNGISFLTLDETPGMGLKAKDEDEIAKYKDHAADELLTYTKTGASAPNEVDAISGATITTNAVVKCVNGAITAVKTVEGGAS
ncbi:MAG: RnfABCDGE type electron transport complex subunit G [Eubacterium sp.]|nr:RnfABCDGE type electron transport complex subunit G [Eubacterium sp.]